MEIYQHFRKEEQPFIDQVISWQQDVAQTYASKLTDFLDPREQFIFSSIIGNHPDFRWGFYGGFKQAERKRAIIAPYYEELSSNDYEVCLLEATYPIKFIRLEHRDALGAFMSLGIKRNKLGDLNVTDGRIQILVTEDIRSYVEMNLTGIKKASVQFKEQSLENLLSNNEFWAEQQGTVSSLRLDVLLKEVYNISRQKSNLLISRGNVKVNHRVIENASFQVGEGDMMSVRGMGRGKIMSIDGQTKKEKWRITSAVLK